jgi:sodium/potassium-transporting ATPase subunit alpha
MCRYVLPAGTFSEVLTVLVNTWMGSPPMLSSFYMVMISCTTGLWHSLCLWLHLPMFLGLLADLFASLALIYEKPESDLLRYKPESHLSASAGLIVCC